MIYSYTQISQYLACPRSYRHRYLDGWREKDTRANLLFGRVFEKALAALSLRHDTPAFLFPPSPLAYSAGLQSFAASRLMKCAHGAIPLKQRLWRLT